MDVWEKKKIKTIIIIIIKKRAGRKDFVSKY
jgi:hypothetical protein